MFKFGFELEGFFIDDKEISIPPKDYPTDGFPGLVEIRTKGGQNISDAYADIIVGCMKHPGVVFDEHEATFEPRQRAELRRRYEYKSAWDIQNIYGKNPRALGNRTIASLQLNISNEIRTAYRDKEGHEHPTLYGLFDVPKVVRALDERFRNEIRGAKRQPGEYAIKDNRLEYRSLPNSSFPFDLEEAKDFLEAIENCLK